MTHLAFGYPLDYGFGTVGYGANIPAEQGITEEAKMRSRRVEIIIIGEKE